MTTPGRAILETRLRGSRSAITELCQALVQVPSENPPGDTTALVEAIEARIAGIAGIAVNRIVAKAPAVNLLISLQGARPGRRLVINGHLDTFPAGDKAGWTRPPFGGQIVDGRLYGRGASDMKAGLAAALLTLEALADHRTEWGGELVLTLAGDEETGGKWGTEYLLNHVPQARGDAMLNGDAGAPQVLRFGEKGRMWVRIAAHGVSNHGAHVHLGHNAIERLLAALGAVLTLRERPCPIPADIAAAIAAGAAVSEQLSGAGETKVLGSITVNIGKIEGGSAINIIPDRAEAMVDIRFPPGIDSASIRTALDDLLRPLDGIDHEILACNEANWTSPDHEIVRLTERNAKALLGADKVVSTMRVGFSDSRFYREHGVPSVVYGPAPFNMGGADEYILLDDLFAVFYVHALTAYDYLMTPAE